MGDNCAPFPTLSSPDEPISAIPVKHSFEQKKEMTFVGRLANVRAPVVRSLYCPSSQTWHRGIGEEDFAGAAIAPWQSLRLSIGWLYVLLTDTEGIAVAPLVQNRCLNCPGKKHISGVGMPLFDVAKLWKNISWHISCYFLMFTRIFSISAISCSVVIRWACQH